MQEELIVTRREQHILSVRVEDGTIVQIQADPVGQAEILGNIYVGKVRNVVKNINAAFVEFQKGQMGYLSLDTDVLPVHTDGAPYQPGRICIGDEIIVQVVREAVRTKPPVLSGKIELPGRYVVLSSIGETSLTADDMNTCDLPMQNAMISHKIRVRKQRKRLRQIILPYCTTEYGFIARTNSASVSEETLRQEIEALVRQYRDLMSFGIHRAIFSVLNQTPGGYLSQIRDSYQDRLVKIWTDDDILYQEMDRYMLENGWQIRELLTRWNPENGKLDAVYDISKTLEHALMPRVWLKSGGYLVIQPTEALVAIDVNTGKAVSRKKDAQQTFRKVNLEAAQEIAKQLRLRNLSGMILIDFIDMKSSKDQQDVMSTLRNAMQHDSVQTMVVDMTALGLVEVTRKKVRKPLWEQLRTGNKEEPDRN